MGVEAPIYLQLVWLRILLVDQNLGNQTGMRGPPHRLDNRVLQLQTKRSALMWMSAGTETPHHQCMLNPQMNEEMVKVGGNMAKSFLDSTAARYMGSLIIGCDIWFY